MAGWKSTFAWMRKTSSDIADDDCADAVNLSRLAAILELGYSAHLLNATITLSLMLLYYFGNAATSYSLLFWGVGNLLLVVARMGHQARLKRQSNELPAATLLKRLAGSQLAAGLYWALLPLMIENLNFTGTHTYIAMIMACTAAGAAIRGVPYAPMVFGFAVPPGLSLALALWAEGSFNGRILGLNALLGMIILVQACLQGARGFKANAIMRHQATGLAQSLKDSNEALQQLATSDTLTGLANRSKFNDDLSFALEHAKRPCIVALFIIDLDRFKFVNDTLGHAAGDSLLVEVGRRLTLALAGQGNAARLGGDEFAVVLSGQRSPRDVMTLADQCLRTICQPIRLAGREIMVQASLGVAVFPQHAQSVDELFACADRALYRSKKIDQCLPAIFSSDMRKNAERQSRIELDVRDALLSGQLDVWFQPQVRMSDGMMIGIEALIRWDHPDLGPVSPMEIVEAAHARRAHELLTSFVTEATCRMLERLHRLGHNDLTAAINLSAQDFAHYDVPSTLAAITSGYGIDPRVIELEFTEDALLDPKLHGEPMQRLDQLGFRLAIDDFGMGSTSLNYLMHMRIDRLKIDRGFVHGVAENRHSQALVTAMVAMGRMLDIDILVEGVETEEDRTMLRLLGCEAGQGFLFARPMAASQLMRWLEKRRVAA